jgi:hypothetical protein
MSKINLRSYVILSAFLLTTACNQGEGTGLLDLTVIAPPELPMANRLELEGTPNIKRSLQVDFPLPGKTSLRVQYPNLPPGSISLSLIAFDAKGCPIASKKFIVKIETGKKLLLEVKLEPSSGPCGDAGTNQGITRDGAVLWDLGSAEIRDTVSMVFDDRATTETSSFDGMNHASTDASADQSVSPLDLSPNFLIDAQGLDVPFCQTKPRDCTSSLDNDCNGIPDNQETKYCVCTQGETQGCEEHPGKDGKGICVAGTQECEFSADKSTSAWSKTCAGSLGPATLEVCDLEKKDENCDGQANEGCECVSGTESDCGTCGGKATCVNGILGTCNKLPQHRDCTSEKDNDCNGTPDKMETTFCKCLPGKYQNCDEHSGKDGKGICVAGKQACEASTDKTTSNWSKTCIGAVGPGLEICDTDKIDEDCDGQLNEGCECISNDTSTPCANAKCDIQTGAFTPAAFCNSQGKCSKKDAIQCAPYNCTATGCATACSVDGECIGARCSINKKCEPCGTLNLPCCVGSDCGSNSCQQEVCKVPEIQTTLAADASNTGTCLENSEAFATDRIAMADGVRGNISFKLETIPRDAIVVSAMLRIYQESVTHGATETLILTKLIDNCWTPDRPIQENTATWLPIVTWIERDVAAFVQSSLISRSPLLTIKLDIGDEAGTARIAHVGTTNQPTLTVRFHF